MIGSRPDQASTEPFSSAERPSACCKFCTVTSAGSTPASSSAWIRKKYGSVPLVAATFLPSSWDTSVISESAGTTRADHSGWEYRLIVLMGEPLARASSAAEPAVEPMSIASARRASLALFEPADWTHSTSTPSSVSSSSSHPFSLMTRESGL